MGEASLPYPAAGFSNSSTRSLGFSSDGHFSLLIWNVFSPLFLIFFSPGAEEARGEPHWVVPGRCLCLPRKVPWGSKTVQKEWAWKPSSGHVLGLAHVWLRQGNSLQLNIICRNTAVPASVLKAWSYKKTGWKAGLEFQLNCLKFIWLICGQNTDLSCHVHW